LSAEPRLPDVTGWPGGFADVQITTEATMASMVFPRERAQRRQGIMSA
jgi:hypothetical protein